MCVCGSLAPVSVGAHRAELRKKVVTDTFFWFHTDCSLISCLSIFGFHTHTHTHTHSQKDKDNMAAILSETLFSKLFATAQCTITSK